MESERDLPVDRRGVWFIGIVEQRQVGPEQLHHVERLAGLDRNAEDLRPACEEPLSENWGTRPRKFVMTPALTYAQFREDLMKERWRSKWTEDWNASGSVIEGTGLLAARSETLGLAVLRQCEPR